MTICHADSTDDEDKLIGNPLMYVRDTIKHFHCLRRNKRRIKKFLGPI